MKNKWMDTFARNVRRTFRKACRDCENCRLSWETRYPEGDCDCGCVLYGQDGRTGIACFLPDIILRQIRRRKDREHDDTMAAEIENMAAWFAKDQMRQTLFTQALRTKLFTDADGKPAQPMYQSPSGKYYPYEPTDMWEPVRMNYTSMLDNGTPPEKAFQKAISEYLAPELYYDTGNGRYETFRIFANCPAAREEYHRLLEQNDLSEK